ncbi:MAG: hypothetical protein QF406_04360 [Verrucomicrobiota bacterium]|jgi:hypothetical protein|nr:hypothetical protein [Verrucomicrobiota bacterium]
MKLFTDPLKGSLTVLLCGAFFMGEIRLLAAIAPLSQKQLDEQSELIVTGIVGVTESKVQKSKIERALGIHRDRIYTIKLGLISLHKSPPLEQGLGFKEQLVVEAWRPVTRIPPLPGLQGHQSIPKKGDLVKMYLKWNKKKAVWEPLLPNGIEITKKDKK